MDPRNRSAIILGAVALALFIIRWPVDDYMANPTTWHSQTVKVTKGQYRGQYMPWREPPMERGNGIFDLVFKGGAGTPAIFAMLGGQRYVVANILWNYSDILFHQGKIYDMIPTLGSCVALNPGNTDAWSLYGWHMAWNLYVDCKQRGDIAGMEMWLEKGELAYTRAMQENPDKPATYFDFAWLQMQRRGDYVAAIPYLQYIVESGKFEPMTLEEHKAVLSDTGVPDDNSGQLTPAQQRRKFILDHAWMLEKKWNSRTQGHQLAFCYKQLGIITGEVQWFEKSVATYRKCAQVDVEDTTALHLATEIRKNERNRAWILAERSRMTTIRENFGLPALTYDKPVSPKAWHELIEGPGEILTP